ncbi:hypothetical protein MXS87_11580 [Escherichia coli]|nr:hypothetical protein [Escherichia coli]
MRCSSGFCFYQRPPVQLLTVVRNGKAPPDISAISALTAVQTWQLQFTYTASTRYAPENH